MLSLSRGETALNKLLKGLTFRIRALHVGGYYVAEARALLQCLIALQHFQKDI